MRSLQDTIYDDLEALVELAPPGLYNNPLTYDDVRDMLVFVRQLKTKLEVLWAEKENERG